MALIKIVTSSRLSLWIPFCISGIDQECYCFLGNSFPRKKKLSCYLKAYILRSKYVNLNIITWHIVNHLVNIPGSLKTSRWHSPQWFNPAIKSITDARHVATHNRFIASLPQRPFGIFLTECLSYNWSMKLNTDLIPPQITNTYYIFLF